MKFKNKRRWRIILNYCIGWTAAFIFLIIVRVIGATEDGHVDYDLKTGVMVSFILGPFFGSISGFAQILMEERLYKRFPIKKLLLLRFVYAVLFLTGIILAGYTVSRLFLGMEMGFAAFAFDDGSFPIYFYILTVDFLMVVFRQVNLLLGENQLLKLLTGKFYTPREEERIFMFLDLRSSTEHAEKLGHMAYSRLIQDCFNDLGVVVENEAEIYQYVGDEVILTWKINAGIRNHNCINAFYNFKQRLGKKHHYYQEQYQCIPFFKAGMNAGIVTVTEIGKYKKEIAYHGDTINTAARIQSKCNEYDQELLISEYLKNQLNPNGFKYHEIGSVDLKGKENHVPIYAVSETSQA